MFSIDHGHDAVELILVLDPLVDEKALHHRCGIGKTGGLDH
jgi:hypothetical protein